MVFTGVVHHKVETDGDAVGMTIRREILQILHGPELRLDAAKIGDRIAAVTAADRAFQKRHEMEIIDAAVPDIIQLLPNTAKGARKCVHIHQHADQFVALIPGGICQPEAVNLPEVSRAVLPTAVEHFHKVIPGLCIAVIEGQIEFPEFFLMGGKTL